MKNFFVFGLVLCVLASVPVMDLQAQVKQVSPQKLKIPAGKLQLKFRTDLRVDVIHSSRCKCDLSDVNAFYMANIMVDVSNHKTGGVGAATASVLTVKYFDMNQGRMVTVTKNLAVLNPYPKNPWTFQRVVVVNRPVLVKKSVGITAVIKPKSTRVSDPVPANNRKIVRKCSPMVY
ncbi:MAG: hypothetical protein GY940_33535 [bacterium]|nr:hypothetical protein [bacterium]